MVPRRSYATAAAYTVLKWLGNFLSASSHCSLTSSNGALPASSSSLSASASASLPGMEKPISASTDTWNIPARSMIYPRSGSEPPLSHLDTAASDTPSLSARSS